MSGACSLAIIAGDTKRREWFYYIAEQDNAVNVVAMNRGTKIDEAKLRAIKPEIVLCSFECLGTSQHMCEVIARDLDRMAEVVWVCHESSRSFFDSWTQGSGDEERLVVVAPEDGFTKAEEKSFAWEIALALHKAVAKVHGKPYRTKRVSCAKQVSVSCECRHGERHDQSPGGCTATFIGISTGGPDALGCMIPAIPGDLPGPVFIVQHMPENFTELLASMLDQQSMVKVVEAKNGMEAKPGVVYLAPGGKKHMKVAKDAQGNVVIRLVNGMPVNNCVPSADVLFRSAVEVYGNKALGIVMTGMGMDGARGLLEMSQCGCVTAAQDKNTSMIFGMPGESLKIGATQVTLPLDQIAGYIARKMGSVYEHNAYAL